MHTDEHWNTNNPINRCTRHGNLPTYSGKIDGTWIHLCDECHKENVQQLRIIFKASYLALGEKS